MKKKLVLIFQVAKSIRKWRRMHSKVTSLPYYLKQRFPFSWVKVIDIFFPLQKDILLNNLQVIEYYE